MRSLDPIAIDALLPQTQCTQCGYSGCMPYAEAIAKGAAGINQCPPGGDEGIHALSMLTELPYAPLNPVHGEHQPRVLAVIDKAACIGCTICIQKCPVDAIAGAAKLMHTVIASECTGCELCVAPCPVDCIALVPAPASHPALAAPQAAADTARQRHRARLARLQRLARRRTEGRAASDIPAEAGIHGPMGPGVRRDDIRSADPPPGSPEHKKRAIAAAQARARARRDASRTP